MKADEEKKKILSAMSSTLDMVNEEQDQYIKMLEEEIGKRRPKVKKAQEGVALVVSK